MITLKNKKETAFAIATVFGVGRMPAAPGTWGSLAGLIVCLLLYRWPIVYYSVFVILFFAGVISSKIVEESDGIKDPSYIVIDEFACIFLIFFLITPNILNVVVGFSLFRLLDIFKPYPARNFENIKNGWGVMLDDLMVAVYVNVILQGLTYFSVI